LLSHSVAHWLIPHRRKTVLRVCERPLKSTRPAGRFAAAVEAFLSGYGTWKTSARRACVGGAPARRHPSSEPSSGQQQRVDTRNARDPATDQGRLEPGEGLIDQFPRRLSRPGRVEEQQADGTDLHARIHTPAAERGRPR
jgi:hypothetical protein